MVALLVACNDIYGPTEDPTVPVYSDGIEITVNSVEDNSATFTLTPKGESTYYSYLLDQSDAAEKLDSSKVLSVSYKSVAQGTVKWSENKSKSISVSGLQANSSYVIYAVAGSATGIPSAVVTATFKTSDKESPVVDADACEAGDSEVVLAFSEDVVKGVGDITIKYYALYSSAIDEGKPLGIVRGQVTDVKGSKATVAFTGVPDGAFYTVDVAAGAFKDLVGNPCDALESTLYYDGESNSIVGANVYGRRSTKNFTIGNADQTLITDWESEALTADFGSSNLYATFNSRAEVSMSYVLGSKTTTFALTAGQDFGYSSSTGKVLFILPEEPERGSQVVVNVPAQTFVDFYGNVNAPWTATVAYAFDYTLETVLGTYNVDYSTCFNSGQDLSGTDVIVASDNAEKGNIMFTSLFGAPLSNPVYATFEPQLGEITIPSGQAMFQMKDKENNIYTACIYCGAVSNNSLSPSTSPVVFNMTSARTIENTYYFGIFLFDAQGKAVGWYDAYMGYEAVKTAAGKTNAPVGTLSITSPLIPLNQAKIVK